MRAPIERTYEIDLSKYGVLLNCCKKYYDYIAWKYPEKCADGLGCCGLDEYELANEIQYEIPTLFLNGAHLIDTPRIHNNVFSGESSDKYDQYALIDFIEFMANNVRDIIKKDYHDFFRHYHITHKNSNIILKDFRKDINDCFFKTGLLYELNSNLQVERIIENDVVSTDMVSASLSIREKGTRDLIAEALALHRSCKPREIRNSVEKLWDAFERLKTYYMPDKKQSISKIVSDISIGNDGFEQLLNAEFFALTNIGNSYRIRHHETDKIDIVDIKHYDYLFNRCFSLMSLAVQYLD